MKNYDNPHCMSFQDFEDDLKTIRYIKRLISKYQSREHLESHHCRLLLNHIITMSNVFGVDATKRILFFKLEKSQYSVLKTCFLYLNYMTDVVQGINGKNILSSDIPVDPYIADELRRL